MKPIKDYSYMKKIWDGIDWLAKQIMMFLFAKLFHKDYTESQHKSFMQFIKFGIVGLSNTPAPVGTHLRR